jgi:ribose transport system substrate-binding protein
VKPIIRCGVVAAALLAGASLTACSAGPADGPRSNKIAVVVASTKQEFGVEMMGGFTAGASEVGGVEVLATGTELVDGPKQVSIFEGLTASHPGGITTFTVNPDLFAAAQAAAGAKGVPLISLDTPPAPSSNVGLLVSNDNVELGRQLAAMIAERLPPGAEGTIVVGTKSPGAQILDERAQGLREEFARRLPGVTVLGPLDTKQDPGENLKAWRLLVRANKHALAFLGTGEDASNLVRVRRETEGTWLAGAVTGTRDALLAVKAGDLSAVSAEHWTEGMVAGRLQARHATTGEDLPTGWIMIPGLPITSGNVDEIIARDAGTATRNAWSRRATDEILGDPETYLRPMPGDE